MNGTRMYFVEKVCEFLGREVNLYTLKELSLKIYGLAKSADVYTVNG